jgi:hypothetical protein
MAAIDLKTDAPAVEAAAVHGRIVGATAEEISGAIATIPRVLKHPTTLSTSNEAPHPNRILRSQPSRLRSGRAM